MLKTWLMTGLVVQNLHVRIKVWIWNHKSTRKQIISSYNFLNLGRMTVLFSNADIPPTIRSLYYLYIILYKQLHLANKVITE